MKENLICWSLAVWLSISPTFAAGFVSNQLETNLAAEAEEADSDELECGDLDLSEFYGDRDISSNVSSSTELDSIVTTSSNAAGKPAMESSNVSLRLCVSSGPVNVGRYLGGGAKGPHDQAESEDTAILQGGETEFYSSQSVDVPDDVPESHYAFAFVSWAVNSRIVSGYSDHTFRPDNPCTHWHILTFLWRKSGSPKYTYPELPYTDVAGASEERLYVARWAKQNGLRDINGELKGNDTCNRDEAMRYIWILAGRPAPLKIASFSDMPTDSEYAKAISWAVEQGIAGGYGDGAFRPNNPCTRAHIVKFLFLSSPKTMKQGTNA